MSVGISIRNPGVVEKVKRAADTCGVGITEVVSQAIDQLLAGLVDDQAVAARREAIDDLVQRAKLEHGPGHVLTDSEMYDETGLPRW